MTSFHFSVLSFIPSDQKVHFWGKKVYLVQYYYRKFQKESFDSLILPANPSLCHKKKSILLFPYLNCKFNRDLFEQYKTPNLYIQQNTWFQKSTIKVFISNKICVVIIHIRLAMTVMLSLNLCQVIFPYEEFPIK